MRYDYTHGVIEETALSESPFAQMQAWLSEAELAGVVEPGAMCLSTVSPEGKPSSRFVLLRGLDEQGLVFFTNYASRKGEDIEVNPFVCIAIWWRTLERQIRVEGTAERVPAADSDAYFASRPRDSQLASAASPQSEVVDSRESLEQAVQALAEEYSAEVPRPEHWGGYRIVPSYFEFWQGRPARLHDRVAYSLQEDRWRKFRLAP